MIAHRVVVVVFRVILVLYNSAKSYMAEHSNGYSNIFKCIVKGGSI